MQKNEVQNSYVHQGCDSQDLVDHVGMYTSEGYKGEVNCYRIPVYPEFYEWGLNLKSGLIMSGQVVYCGTWKEWRAERERVIETNVSLRFKK